jgi:hypothetical protein
MYAPREGRLTPFPSSLDLRKRTFLAIKMKFKVPKINIFDCLISAHENLKKMTGIQMVIFNTTIVR